MLFESFEDTDCTGSRICALDERADVQGLRFVSKKIFNITGLCWELVAWVLVAQRMFDPIPNEKVLAPAAVKRPSFIQENLLALRKKYADVNLNFGETGSSAAELQKRQSNLSGCAGASSGHIFFEYAVRWCRFVPGVCILV